MTGFSFPRIEGEIGKWFRAGFAGISKIVLAYYRMTVLLCVMPRQKEFDEAEVLDQAVELFRARGYQSTSFCDLTSELGVSRQSLYDTYGDKQTLFLASLKRYRERALDRMRRALAAPGPIRPLLEQFFTGAMNASCKDEHPGCLMVNSMVEMAPHDPAIRALAVAHARDIEGLFAARLSLAQRSGDIAKGKDPVALARYLHHTLLGLAVAARAFGEREAIAESARLALLALD
jgi:TetR/AcrR family transcriptional repressor of nem operon